MLKKRNSANEQVCLGGCGIDGCSGAKKRHPCNQARCKNAGQRYTCVEMQYRAATKVKIYSKCPAHRKIADKSRSQPTTRESSRELYSVYNPINNPINSLITSIKCTTSPEAFMKRLARNLGSRGDTPWQPLLERIQQDRASGLGCETCDRPLVYLSKAGLSMYSPDRPRRDSKYADRDWLRSCWACNRFFNDMTPTERKEALDLVITRYNPSAVDGRSVCTLTPAERKNINAIWRRQESNGLERLGVSRRAWSLEDCMTKASMSGKICEISGIEGSFVPGDLALLTVDRHFDDDLYTLTTTQVILERLNDLKEAITETRRRGLGLTNDDVIRQIRAHIEGLIAFRG